MSRPTQQRPLLFTIAMGVVLIFTFAFLYSFLPLGLCCICCILIWRPLGLFCILCILIWFRTFACHFVLIFSKTRIKTNAKVKIRKKLHFVLFLFDFEHLLFISFLFVAFASRRRPRGKTRIKKMQVLPLLHLHLKWNEVLPLLHLFLFLFED